MKTVSGTVVSTKPISLSRAASTLKAFVSSSETGASNTISVFLKRASDSFSELVQFHRDLKSKRSKPKFKSRPFESSLEKEKLGDAVGGGGGDVSGRSVDLREEQIFRYSEVSEGRDGLYEEEGSRKNTKKKRSERDYSIDGEKREVRRGGLGYEEEEEKSSERKKKKKVKIEDGELGDSEEQQHGRKKKKKKKKKKWRHEEES